MFRLTKAAINGLMVGFDWNILKMLSTVNIKWEIQTDGSNQAKFSLFSAVRDMKLVRKNLHGNPG